MQSFKYEKLNVIDDRLVQHEPVVKMYRGSEQSSRLVAKPVGGSINQSQVQFNISCTPSNYFDRKPMLKTTFDITVQALATANVTIPVSGNATPLTKSLTAPGTDVTMSAYPASNVFGLCNVEINGTQVCTYDMAKYSSILTRLGNVSKNMSKSTCASCPELSFANCDDANYTLSNSQGNYNDSTTNYIGNGSWTFDSVSANNSGVGEAQGGNIVTLLANGKTANIVYRITSYEPLILPPFIYNSSQDNSEAIFGMSNLMVTLNVNNLTAYRSIRCLSTAVASTCSLSATSGNAAFNLVNCELHYKTFRAPSIIDFKLPSPLSIFHTYNFYNNFIISSQAFGPAVNGVSTITSGLDLTNVTSTGMPSLIAIWCDKPTAYLSNYAKYYYPITKLNIDLGTTQSMLNTYEIAYFYGLSEECGLEQSYLSFLGRAYSTTYASTGIINATGASSRQLVGGPILLRPGISFPLPSEVSTNSSGSFTWAFHAQCMTTNAADIANAVKPNLNIMMIYDTWVSIDTSTLQCSVNKAMLTVPEVLGMARTDAVTIDDIRGESGGALQSHDVVKSGGGFKASGKLASRVRK